MNAEEKNRKEQAKEKDSGRGRTDVPGQNPKQDDRPSKDVHHDEKRKNPLAKE